MIDIIVPSFNGRELVRRFLENNAPSLAKYRLGVVDDASEDGSVEFLRSNFPEVLVVAREKNGGFAAAVNDGIRATDSDLIVLLNNDVEVNPNFLDPILPLFEDERVFAISPRIIVPSLGGLDEGAKTGFWRHGIFYTSQLQNPSGTRPILYATGCAAVYRRSHLEELGGFDEAYSPFYWEDADLGYRAWKRGWKTIYQPSSQVIHQHSASVSRFDPKFTGRIKARNGLFFIWRNIEDERLLATHRRWLPLVVVRRIAARDWPWIAGFREAWNRRREAIEARARDSIHRRLSDTEIFDKLGIENP
ncbi:MAG: glycosyltransferase family 2 protein [Armatimonadetes bacterium]|nr:glycosyltransferase family 2 protein [Armatimonadota bacterium]